MYKNFLLYKFFALAAFCLLTFYFTVPAVFFHNIPKEISKTQKDFSVPEFDELTYKVWNFYSKNRYSNLSVPAEQANDLKERIKNYHEVGAISLPIWRFSLFAPNYPIEAFPQGLPIFIHMDGLSGEVHEMDTINHYIGMKPMAEGAKLERQLVPYILMGMSLFILLFLLLESKILNWLMILPVVTPFAFLVVYIFWLYLFGHDLVDGAIAIKPFMPVVVGGGQVAQFTTMSYPENGFWMLLVISLFSILSLFFKKRAGEQYKVKFGLFISLIFIAITVYFVFLLAKSDLKELIMEKQETIIEKTQEKEQRKEQKEQDEIKDETETLKQNIPTSALVKVSAIYKTRCSSCHGAKGEGSVSTPLINLERDRFFEGLEDELHIEIIESLTSEEVEALYEESKSF